MSLIRHSDGAVYMVVVGAASGDILAFDFGGFYDMCTFRRWTAQVICYRAQEAGSRGMVLIFPTDTSLDRFEAACDRNLPSHAIETSAPTLEQLRDLGLVAVPRVLGSFLLEGRTETATNPPQQESTHDDGDEGYDTFLLSDWARTIARPPPAFALDRADGSLLEQSVDSRSPDPVSTIHVEGDSEENSETSSIGDLSDLSDLDVSDLDADDLAELVEEVDEIMEDFDVLLCDMAVTRRFEFPGSFV
ncbi:hypothetical protein C8T65DRAFT_736256 [Cerioporus squamosus]|nr:hypothetical protein C8T65DRAFT_736256 [Cerioporus squamosus]